MSLTPEDRRWLRRAIREIVRDELEKRGGDAVQLGGYEPLDVDDEGDMEGHRRRPIGFLHRQGSNVTQ